MGLFSFLARGHSRATPTHDRSSHRPDTAAAGTPGALSSGAITIFGADKRIAALVPGTGVAVTALPYIIGRVPEDDEDVSRQPIGLFLRDDKPYRLSRRHFAIVRRDGEYWVLDGSSHLGTVVNGHTIGRKFGRDAATLQSGENQVVAGGPGSEYVFRIVLG
ncbi:MAG: FHA domain-containing protein [Gammaproteobacteria bacterium]|nr:FHA domain-containing protein [Gammaproteobacteria bacterium]